MIVKQLKNIFVLLFKIFFFNLRARGVKRKDHIVFVAEFDTEGGAFTYFKYMLEYFAAKKISYLLVLSGKHKQFVEENIKIPYCLGIIEGPEVWRPYFTKKNALTHNLHLFINQLQELLFFSKLNVKHRPAYFYFSVTNPEHYLFEFCVIAKLFYVCHTLTNDPIDRVKGSLLNLFLGKNKNIILVSHFARELLIETWRVKGSSKRFIHVVHNYYHKINNGGHKKKKVTAFTVLTIGSVEWYKDPSKWCEVAKMLTDMYGKDSIDFFWLGSGSLKDECQQSVSRYHNISFVGYCRDVEMYYNIADVYMQPSISESFGISVVGAMAHKIPCVVSAAGGLKEVVCDNETGFIINGNSNEMYVDKLRHLLNNPRERTKLGEGGYIKFMREFTKQHWDAKMGQLLADNHIE